LYLRIKHDLLVIIKTLELDEWLLVEDSRI